MSESKPNNQKGPASGDESKLNSPNTKSSRLFRFGIRGLLVAVTLCAAVLGYWNYKYAPLMRAAALFESKGVQIEYFEPGDIELKPLDPIDEFVFRFMGIDVDFRNVQTLDVWGLKSAEPIRHFENLEYLSAANCSFDDLSPLSGLKRLGEVVIESDRISDLSPLNGLPELSTIGIESESLKALSSLQDCIKLKSLDVDADNLEDISKIGAIENLEFLGVLSKKLKDISALSELTTLKDLHLSDCPIEDISPLEKLSRLLLLDINRTLVSDISAVSHMPLLNELRISQTKVTDLGPLAYVIVDGNRFLRKDSPTEEAQRLSNQEDIADNGSEPFSKHFQSLEMEATPVVSLKALTGFKYLEALVVRGSKINSLDGLQASRLLKDLDLRDTDISDLSPLKGFNDLVFLTLDDCKLESLETLPVLSLRRIELGGPHLKSIAGIRNASLGTYGDLLYVRISNCQVNDLSELGWLPDLEKLYLTSIPATKLPKFESVGIEEFQVDKVPILDFSPILNCAIKRLTIKSPDPNCDGGFLEGLKYPRALSNLRIENVRLGDLKVLTRLSELSDLKLIKCDASGYESLGLLSSLQSLKIVDTELEDIGWVASCEELRTVEFPGSRVSDISSLGRLAEIQVVNLNGCPVSDLTPLVLGGAKLYSLRLNRTEIKDLEFVRSMLSLGELQICDTNVTDLSPLLHESALPEHSGVGLHSSTFGTNIRSGMNLQMAGVQLDDPSLLSRLSGLHGLDISGTNVTNPADIPRNLSYLVVENVDLDLQKVQEHLLGQCVIETKRPEDPDDLLPQQLSGFSCFF